MSDNLLIQGGSLEPADTADSIRIESVLIGATTHCLRCGSWIEQKCEHLGSSLQRLLDSVAAKTSPDRYHYRIHRVKPVVMKLADLSFHVTQLHEKLRELDKAYCPADDPSYHHHLIAALSMTQISRDICIHGRVAYVRLANIATSDCGYFDSIAMLYVDTTLEVVRLLGEHGFHVQ